MRSKKQHRRGMAGGLILAALLLGVGVLFLPLKGAATAMPNPPALLRVQPTVESSPQPTRMRESGATVLLENSGAPTLPAVDLQREVKQNGITVRLEGWNAQALPQGRVDVQVCFSLPAGSLDWIVGDAWIETSAGPWPLTQGVLVRYEKAADGTVWRCEALTFEAPQAALQKSPRLARLVIASLLGPRGEQPDCGAIQQALAATGIQVAPIQGEGVGGCRVVSKPASMSQEEAEAQLAALLLPHRRGPWVFALRP